MAKEIAEEYASSLADLTVNSKPLINMLTILAEENIDHAGVIVETVEKHLEKVHPDIKLPVLYLVDSIIKNVGGAYIQKFSQSIVNMFTRTFKQVDEKIRSQMFKLRETWHDVFPATKLYQLDVKVNLIDPAWPIQAQPQQSNIHNAPAPSATVAQPPAIPAPVLTEEEEKMRSLLAKKEQELLMLQRKKIEMELEQTKRQLEMAEKNAKKVTSVLPPTLPVTMPVAMVNPVMADPAVVPALTVPVKARLGPPVSKGRIAPVSASLASARRDPRLARGRGPPSATPAPQPPPIAPPPPTIAPNVFDIKPLERVTKRKNVITYDVQPDVNTNPIRRDPRDPRLAKPKPDRPDKPDRQERTERVRKERTRRDERRRNDEERDKKRPEPKKAEDEPKERKEEEPPKMTAVDAYIDKLMIADPKRINRLPPIPKINRDEPKDKDKDSPTPSPVKKRKEERVDKKKKRDTSVSSKDSSSGSSPDKKAKGKRKPKPQEEKPASPEVVAFKELKNYHKERYMRRNKQQSPSPETQSPAPAEPAPTAPTALIAPTAPSAPEVAAEAKDVDLRVLPTVEPKPAPVAQKRPSTEALESKTKKTKIDKFDILFGNEDVDLRQLPLVDETPPSASESPEKKKEAPASENDVEHSPVGSPKKDWNEVKEKTEDVKKTPSKLDLVRAKLAEATKGKDRLGRPLRFMKSPSVEKSVAERRRTISTEDTDMRTEPTEDFDAEDHKKTISIIMNQAKEQFNDGQLDKNQYNTLMYQVLQLNEKLKLKEAKQRESLELSKRKLKAHIQEQNKSSPKAIPNRYGDIDERVVPYIDTPPDSQPFMQDSDMRMMEPIEPRPSLLPLPPSMPIIPPYVPPYSNNWRGPRPRVDEYVPRRFRGPAPPFYRGKFENRPPRPQFEPRLPIPPPPKVGQCQGDCPLRPYQRIEPPPPLGAPGIIIPPTDYDILEYIDQDPVKTIQIDGVPREIRFYGETGVIMLDWDDPREIKFLPGCRRVTFDNKDSVVLSFNEPYKQVEIDDHVFDIRLGAPTRELYINGRWFECFFGGAPFGVIVDGTPHFVQLEGPLPQVDIGKERRTDLVAGKINLIVNATQMCPVFLDAKVQKFMINGEYFTIRFVDSLRTVLINEQPFRVEYGDLPKPIVIGNEKFFIRFSALPRNVKPGMVSIAGMEGSVGPLLPPPLAPGAPLEPLPAPAMDVDLEMPRPAKTPSPDGERKGLDMLASVMPTSVSAPLSATEYTLAEPLFSKSDTIPGLDTPNDQSGVTLPALGNINISDLFAKLVATGIVPKPAPDAPKSPPDASANAHANTNAQGQTQTQQKEDRSKKEDRNRILRVDLLKPETLRVKQPGIVAQLYGGMQCSGCGARFPPEHTVRYSQHLDWHFRQNRKERDSARRAHSRHWHYDLCDWVQYEEIEDLEEREKSWFETGGAEAGGAPDAPAEVPEEAPSVAAGAPQAHHCAVCGDTFDQFYNEDKEEWHLRNAVLHEEKNYHPMCFEDYKASLSKEELPAEPQEDTSTKEMDTISIGDDGDVTLAPSDDEVELVVPEPDKVEQLEIDEGDEDDVVLKAEPVEEVTVDDEADTDDETAEVRRERDKQAGIDFASVKVKQEPIDPDDEPIITAEEENIQPAIDTTHTTVLSSIDGNVQLDPSAPARAAALPLGGIRINISKTIPTFVQNNHDERMLEDISADDEPLPPGEEPELEYKIKPTLENVQLSRQPPLNKGTECSGLCSIM